MSKKKETLVSLELPSVLNLEINQESRFNPEQCVTAWNLATRMLTAHHTRISPVEMTYLRSLAAALNYPHKNSTLSTRELLKCLLDKKQQATMMKLLMLGLCIGGRRIVARQNFIQELKNYFNLNQDFYLQLTYRIAETLDHFIFDPAAADPKDRIRILGLVSKMVFVDKKADPREVKVFTTIAREMKVEREDLKKIGKFVGEDLIEQFRGVGSKETLLALTASCRIAVADEILEPDELRLLSDLKKILEFKEWNFNLIFLYLELICGRCLAGKNKKCRQRKTLPQGLRQLAA